MQSKALYLKKLMENHKTIVKILFSFIVFIITFCFVKLIFHNTIIDVLNSVIVSQFITYMIYQELYDYLSKLENNNNS